MKSKIAAIFTAVLFGSLPLFADTIDQTNEQIINSVNTTLNEMLLEDTPIMIYQKTIEKIQDPSYENLKPIFKYLTVLNETFELGTNYTNHRLANKLNNPVKVGWNSSREVDMTEIFDNYFPQENDDKDIALLEYNIKSNLPDLITQSKILIFQDTKDEKKKQIYSDYLQFTEELKNITSYNPQDTVTSLLVLIKSYNTVKDADSRVGYLAKDILFTLPILTGWGRTFTLKEISTQTGMKESPEGDDITFRSVRELKNMYNLSKQDAKLLEQFVRDCNSIYY